MTSAVVKACPGCSFQREPWRAVSDAGGGGMVAACAVRHISSYQQSSSSLVRHAEQTTSATIAAAAILNMASISRTTAKERGLEGRYKGLAPFPV
jgi:hypothetical protein